MSVSVEQIDEKALFNRALQIACRDSRTALVREACGDDVEMQENTDAPCVGKDANRARELGVFDAVEAWHGAKLLSSVVGGDLSFSEWEFDVTYKGAPRTQMTQVSVRRWRDGKVVHERFYHK